MAFHESWIEKQIREAQERGEFDNLSGAGKPLRGLDDPDPDWWVKKMMAREGLDASDALPPVMLLRRERATFPESLVDVRSEEGVREILRDYNARVIEDRRRPALGKNSPVWAATVDVDEMVEQWRTLRSERFANRGVAPEPVRSGSGATAGVANRNGQGRRWWRRVWGGRHTGKA
ncbi:hypothetical protein N802_07070 [Knoellia sinensis KCTC 19936]|uniref:DnaJ homologue subfamily C member 28 conserved domain-containing protein n=1 Tax=Knoellia sinensis KCTC 19936 TaxID=1385520 RepID=A0A0A0IZZ6_9MICO|nr:DUF1992 domain-containing protein [Knoellia sinensis]KGN30398.1 hypothetical protein N802_07070 [Knoellia sinensis KCTC 19936]